MREREASDETTMKSERNFGNCVTQICLHFVVNKRERLKHTRRREGAKIYASACVRNFLYIFPKPFHIDLLIATLEMSDSEVEATDETRLQNISPQRE
jgi:hypothetical protein